MTNPNHQAIRDTCINRRKCLSQNAQAHHSMNICNQIESLSQYQDANSIALYCATKGEVNLEYLWNASSTEAKSIYFPVLSTSGSLLFLPATPSTPFIMNRYGILEPNSTLDSALSPSKIDIIIAPLVAFDSHGTRLGMGKGYYDRALMHERPGLFLGVAYEFQHQPYIDPNPWDVQLDAIITEKTIYWSKP